MDINQRYQMRKMLREMYPDGEDSSFWVRRLHSQRLLDNSNFIPFSPRPIWSHDVWDSIHREFSRAAEEARKSEDRWFSDSDSNSEGKDRESRRWPRHSLFEDLDRLFHSIENQFSASKNKEKADKAEKGEEPDTFDDLYSSLSSAFSQGAKSLSTLIKLARDGVSEIHKSSSHSSSWSSSWSSSYDSVNGSQKGEKVEEKEEYTDEYGNIHVKRTIRTLDKEGREIGREVHVRVHSPPPNREKEQPRLEGSKHNPDGPGGSNNTKDSKSVSDSDGNSGWFWK